MNNLTTPKKKKYSTQHMKITKNIDKKYMDHLFSWGKK